MSPHRGDVYEADLPVAGPRPVVVATREQAIPVLSSVAVVEVTSTIRDHPAEVPLGREQGLDHESVANCDNVFTIRKTRLLAYRGSLGPEEIDRLNRALRMALGLD